MSRLGLEGSAQCIRARKRAHTLHVELFRPLTIATSLLLQSAGHLRRRSPVPQQTQDTATSRESHVMVQLQEFSRRCLARSVQDEHHRRYIKHQRRYSAGRPRLPCLECHAQPAARPSVSLIYFEKQFKPAI
jgi:hypothetical protein